MGILHIHVVATKNGVEVPTASHIPGAQVDLVFPSNVGAIPYIASLRTDETGVANFDFGPLYGVLDIFMVATTPNGKVGRAHAGGYVAPLLPFNATWVIGVEGAANEGSASADLGAWWNGFGDIGKVAIIAGAVIGIGLIAYIISRWFGRRKHNGNGGQNGKR